jgi:hypothetical protein
MKASLTLLARRVSEAFAFLYQLEKDGRVVTSTALGQLC